MGEWKETKLKNAPFAIIDGDRGKNYPPQSEFSSSGHCLFLSAKNVKKNGFDFSEKQFVSEERDRALSKGKLQRNDIVLTTRGTVGNLAFYSEDVPFENVRINSGMVIVRPKLDGMNPEFCFYLFRALQQNQFEVFSSGSAQPQLPIRDMNEIDLQIPDLPEQKAIAEVLSSLDDKIDLLHRQNKTLESLAQTLFRQLFIEEADDSWEIGVLPDEFDFTMGQSPRGETFNEEGNGTIFYQGRTDFGFRFPEPRVFTVSPTRFAKQFDTLVSVRAPVGDMNMAIEDCSLGRGVASFRLKRNPKYHSYTYYKMRSLMESIKQFEDNGTVFGSIGKEDFKKLENSIPDSDLVDRFQTATAPLDEKIFQNTLQIANLEKARDSLLPKLMSGGLQILL